MDAEGAGRARAAVAARGAPADDGGADGDGREPVRKRRRVGCLRLATRLRMAEAVDAANGGQWPTRRGEERLRATRPRSRARFGTPPAATGSGARRATAGLGGKRAEMAAPSTS